MLTLIRTIAAVSLLAFANLAPMLADETPDPARIDAAMEVILAIGVTQQMDTMVELMINEFATNMTGVEESKKAEFKKTMDAYAGKFRSYQPDMLKEFAMLYAKRFTAEDLAAITAFYRSPTGMKFVAAAPELMRLSGEIGGRYGDKAVAEVNAVQEQP